MASLWSKPITAPVAPTAARSSGSDSPVPQPTSSTRSPGASRSSATARARIGIVGPQLAS